MVKNNLELERFNNIKNQINKKSFSKGLSESSLYEEKQNKVIYCKLRLHHKAGVGNVTFPSAEILRQNV